MKKELPNLAPEYILVNEPYSCLLEQTNVSPPFTEEELRKIRTFRYLYYKFLQENNLTNRKLVENFNDTGRVVLQVRDLTEEGMRFIRAVDERYLNILDFNVDPENRVKRILEKELKKMRI